MKKPFHLTLLLPFALISILLCGCGTQGSSSDGASSATGPKAGHWEGDGPYVSFDVTDAGKIINFTLNAPFATTTCHITLGEIEVNGNEFLVDAKTGSVEEATIGIFTLKGKFNGETISGTQKVENCGRTMALKPEEREWTASWVSSEISRASETSTPLTAGGVNDATQTPVPSPTTAPSPTPVPMSENAVYLAEYPPLEMYYEFGTYSIGVFEFSSEDPEYAIKSGDPLMIGGVEYPHGIFAPANSFLLFDIGQQHGFTEIAVTVGLEGSINCGSGVTFNILGNREPIFTQVIYPGDKPLTVKVPLKPYHTNVGFLASPIMNDSKCGWLILGDPFLQ